MAVQQQYQKDGKSPFKMQIMRLVTHRATDAEVCGCYAGSHGQQCVSQAQVGDEDQRRSFARPEIKGMDSRARVF
jgi:hypothetical protein